MIFFCYIHNVIFEILSKLNSYLNNIKTKFQFILPTNEYFFYKRLNFFKIIKIIISVYTHVYTHVNSNFSLNDCKLTIRQFKIQRSLSIYFFIRGRKFFFLI